MDHVYVFNEDWARRIKKCVERSESPLDASLNRRRRAAVAEGSGCDRQNCIWHIYVMGKPVGGTLDLTITAGGATETITLNWDDTAAEAKTTLATHSGIASESNLTVTGGPFPNATLSVEFKGDLAGQDIALPLASWSNITGGIGTGVIVALSQKGHR